MKDRDIKTLRDVSTEQVVCPDKDVKEECDKATGVWTKTTTDYKRVGCECKPMIKVKRGRCGRF